MATARPKHGRRLSIFGLRASKSFDSEDLAPVENSESAIPFPTASAKSEQFSESVDTLSRQTSLSRSRSRNKKSKAQLKASHPPSSFASQSRTSLASTRVSDSGHSCSNNGPGAALKKNRSLNLRDALSTIFAPKPSRNKIVGILHEVEDRKMARKRGRGIGHDRSNVQSYVYISRSPSPPSPEIRPPSGLGEIASSVNLSAYVEEEREASLLASLSRRESLVPSVGASTLLSPRSNTAPSLTSVSDDERPVQDAEGAKKPPTPSIAPTKPSTQLIEVIALSSSYCSINGLASLARSNRVFLDSARASMYVNLDSRNCRDQEARRALLETLASKPAVSTFVKRFRWVCQSSSGSSSPHALSPKHSIPRRAPNVSLSSSPEEFILPLVLSSTLNLATLELVHPPASLLRSFLPKRPSKRSPASSPVPSPEIPDILPKRIPLKYLNSLTLSGRTTLSTSFGDVLVRFLELFPNITELSLPDVFCLPIATPLLRSPSQNSSSDSSSVSSKNGVPPVPPLPAALSVNKDKEVPPSILPNLKRLKAPLTLATQLVPGRPLEFVDIELATSVYEGLRPADAVRSLSAAEGFTRLPTPNSPNDSMNWRSARQARRAGLPSPCAFKTATLKELRLRCTAKVDGRTIGRVLCAVGSELGAQLELLAIGWSGTEEELHSQLTQCLGRFTVLQRLELSSLSTPTNDSYSDENGSFSGGRATPMRESLADLQAGMALEKGLVEQWARLCPQLSYMEFASHRVWKAR